MGAIYQDIIAEIPRDLKKAYMNSIIEKQRRRKVKDEDYYNGDFGSSSYVNEIQGLEKHPEVKNLKTISLDTYRDIFEDYIREHKRKYEVYSYVVKKLGYAYYTLGAEMNTKSLDRKGYTIKLMGYGKKEFKNYTEMQKFLNNTTSPEYYGCLIFGNSSDFTYPCGEVGFKYFRVYKTKPKGDVEKYKMNSDLEQVIFGGINPY